MMATRYRIFALLCWDCEFFLAQLKESRIAKVTPLPRQIDVETPPSLLLWLRDH